MTNTKVMEMVMKQVLARTKQVALQLKQQNMVVREHRKILLRYRKINKLLQLVEPHLPVINADQAARRGGVIFPAICLYAVLRWLAGGSYSDILYRVGISKSSFYRVLWTTMATINNIPAIKECELYLDHFLSRVRPYIWNAPMNAVQVTDSVLCNEIDLVDPIRIICVL